MYKLFAFILGNSNTAKKIRAELRALQATFLEDALFNNHEDELTFYETAFLDEMCIKLHFHHLNEKYGFFGDKNITFAEERFTVLFRGCKLFSDYVECNNDTQNSLAFMHAYKTTALFDFSYSNYFTPIEKLMNSISSLHRLHDALLFDLPK